MHMLSLRQTFLLRSVRPMSLRDDPLVEKNHGRIAGGDSSSKNHEHGSEHGRFEAFMKVVVRIEFERKSMCWKLFQRN